MTEDNVYIIVKIRDKHLLQVVHFIPRMEKSEDSSQIQVKIHIRLKLKCIENIIYNYTHICSVLAIKTLHSKINIFAQFLHLNIDIFGQFLHLNHYK